MVWKGKVSRMVGGLRERKPKGGSMEGAVLVLYYLLTAPSVSCLELAVSSPLVDSGLALGTWRLALSRLSQARS